MDRVRTFLIGMESAETSQAKGGGGEQSSKMSSSCFQFESEFCCVIDARVDDDEHRGY